MAIRSGWKVQPPIITIHYSILRVGKILMILSVMEGNHTAVIDVMEEDWHIETHGIGIWWVEYDQGSKFRGNSSPDCIHKP